MDNQTGYWFHHCNWSAMASAHTSCRAIQPRILPVTQRWKTIHSVLLGMFTNDRLMEKIEELNSKLEKIMTAMPEGERIYLLEKELAKKKEASEVEVQIVPP